MKILIIGAGYVGLVTGLILSDLNYDVTICDKDPRKIKLLNNKILPFFEPGLQVLLKKALKKKNFKINKFEIKNIDNPHLILICVGTPSINAKISLDQILSVGKTLGKWLKKYNKFCSIVVKSTVIPGTTNTTLKTIIEKFSKLNHKNGDFGLGMNPEFLREGSAVKDFNSPDRIVIGYEDKKTKDNLIKLYSKFDCKKIFTNSKTAEMSKYVNNSLLALQISAINEFANISSVANGTDFTKILEIIKNDFRWSIQSDNKTLYPSILNYLIPGSGFGGSCFPKDLVALVNYATNSGVNPILLKAVKKINDKQPTVSINYFLKNLSHLSKHKNILFLGLSFKENTDDIRESTSIKMINELIKKKCYIKFHDPLVNSKDIKTHIKNKNCTFIQDWRSMIDWANAIIIGTPHHEYKNIVLLNLKENQIIFDPKRFLIETRTNLKCKYLTIG